VVKSTDSQFLRVKSSISWLGFQVRPELPTARGGLAMAVPSGSSVVLAIGGRRTNGEKLDVVE